MGVGWLQVAKATPDDALAQVEVAERQRIEVMDRAGRCAVCIFDENHAGGGSGVIISPDGYGLTNFHVAAALSKGGHGFGGLSDGKLYPLQVLGMDPTGDVAMFRLSGRDSFEAAPLGDSDAVQVGDWVFAMGNPFLLAEDYTPTVTHGLVSGVHRYQFGQNARALVYTDCIQVDASINPGNSGGPLFNAKGEVIGINGRGSFEVRGRVNVGLGYAISANQIKRFIPALQAGLLVEHGSLGATAADLGYRQVVFDKRLDASAAASAGIEVGDKLLRFAGREIHSSNQFANYLGVYPAGWPVQVEFQRGSQRFSRVLRLDNLPLDLPTSLPEGLRLARPTETQTSPDPAIAAIEADQAAKPSIQPSALSSMLEEATKRVAKLYGAGAGEEHGYASGVIVSPDGLVVTAMGLFLETANLRAVVPDGHVYHAECVYRDEYRQLALLKLDRYPENVDAGAPVDRQMTPIQLAALAPASSTELRPGDWIFSVGNNFKVADGDEPVSVLKGVVSGRTKIDALHGTQAFPFRGEVLVLDAITSTPGAPGGALIDLRGRWVGLIGKIVTARQTNTSFNYAYPIEEIIAFLKDAESGAKAATRPVSAEAPPGYHGIRLSKIAYQRQLPFVQGVVAGSPAADAGVKPEDLIVSANGTAIPHARIFNELCKRLHAGDELSLIVKRGDQLVPIRFAMTEPPK